MADATHLLGDRHGFRYVRGEGERQVPGPHSGCYPPCASWSARADRDERGGGGDAARVSRRQRVGGSQAHGGSRSSAAGQVTMEGEYGSMWVTSYAGSDVRRFRP